MNVADTELAGNARSPNPKRVAAGRRNQVKSKGVTPSGRERLRAAALLHRPWQFSTGPRTAAGKAKAAGNGKVRQAGPLSVRELRVELTELNRLADEMRRFRTVTAESMEASRPSDSVR